MSKEIPAIFQKLYTIMDRNKDGKIDKKDDLKSMTADEQQGYIELVKQLPAVISTQMQSSVWVNEKNEVQPYTKEKYDKKITEMLDQYGGEELFKAFDGNKDGKLKSEDRDIVESMDDKNAHPNFKMFELKQALNLLTETQQQKLNKYIEDKYEAGEEISKENFFSTLKEIKEEEK